MISQQEGNLFVPKNLSILMCLQNLNLKRNFKINIEIHVQNWRIAMLFKGYGRRGNPGKMAIIKW
jgi:hypothetical protein